MSHSSRNADPPQVGKTRDSYKLMHCDGPVCGPVARGIAVLPQTKWFYFKPYKVLATHQKTSYYLVVDAQNEGGAVKTPASGETDVLQTCMPRLSPPPSSFGGFSPRSYDLGLFFIQNPAEYFAALAPPRISPGFWRHTGGETFLP